MRFPLFRIFLRKKLLSGQASSGSDEKLDRPSRLRNRRLYQRYKVNQQHLTVMNDQDILVIRDLSANGFSSDVSPRAYLRFELNDVYEARMRYLGELHDMSIKVAWKRNRVVGFEVCQAEPETLNFFRRLLKPVQLANSLAKVDAAFMRETDHGKTWYHGDEGTDLMIWRSPNHQIEAWQLICGDQFVEWRSQYGFSSGVIRQDGSSQSGILKSTEELMIRDKSIDQERLRFVADLIMAIRYDEKHELMETLIQQNMSGRCE